MSRFVIYSVHISHFYIELFLESITYIYNRSTNEEAMNINYEHYKTFYYVAKHKNLTSAAVELNNNQPNISRIIKQLEQEIGCKLILRRSHGIDLTPEGESLFFHVQSAVHQLQAAENELGLIASLRDGHVTIGTSETASYMVLLPALKAFQKMYPNIKVKLLNHTAPTAIDLVREGLVNFAVATVDDELPDTLIATTLLSYTDILVGGPSYKNTKTALSLAEISRLPMVSLGQKSNTYNFYQKLFHQHHLPFQPMYEVETPGQLCPMLMYDLGIAFIPPIYVQNSLRRELLYEIPIADALPQRNICIIESKERQHNLAAKKLRDFCSEPRDFLSF